MRVVKQSMFFFVWIMLNISVQGYTFVKEIPKKVVTHSDKKKLFEKVNCKYVKSMVVHDAGIKNIMPKSSGLEVFEFTKAYTQQLAQHKLAPMYLKWISEKVGYGVFAKKPIKVGDFIGEYSGVFRLVTDNDNIDYAWYYIAPATTGKQLVIDAKFEGNELRFINHASDPNTVKIDVLDERDVSHPCYIAIKDIKKDEQITVSYGDSYWTTRGIKPEAF